MPHHMLLVINSLSGRHTHIQTLRTKAIFVAGVHLVIKGGLEDSSLLQKVRKQGVVF